MTKLAYSLWFLVGQWLLNVKKLSLTYLYSKSSGISFVVVQWLLIKVPLRSERVRGLGFYFLKLAGLKKISSILLEELALESSVGLGLLLEE